MWKKQKGIWPDFECFPPRTGSKQEKKGKDVVDTYPV